MEIGALIKQKRIQKDMKLEELAKRVGVSAATVSRWESGKIDDMKRSRIKALSDTLDIPVWEQDAAGSNLLCFISVLSAGLNAPPVMFYAVYPTRLRESAQPASMQD